MGNFKQLTEEEQNTVLEWYNIEISETRRRISMNQKEQADLQNEIDFNKNKLFALNCGWDAFIETIKTK